MINHLINLFYPSVCAGCNSFLLTGENVICSACRHEIPLTEHSKNPDNEAIKKFYGKIPVEFASAFIYYHKKGIVQEMIHNLKYNGHEEIGTTIGQWYLDDLKTVDALKSVTAIIPVPLHRRKLRERGYNQVTSFGVALAQGLHVEYCDNILFRNTYSKTQTTKNLLNRTDVSNKTIFDVTFSQKHHNKHYLLIDDVLTTGSTLEACGRALLKIPGAKISIVCMAMSHS